MQTMTTFGDFLSEASAGLHGVRPVRIAIVDDGIDHTLDIFRGRIGKGESFQQVAENIHGRWGAFYVPSGTHGTLMAKLICKICPNVELYIAQLEVLPGGRRSFNAESAAEVRILGHSRAGLSGFANNMSRLLIGPWTRMLTSSP